MIKKLSSIVLLFFLISCSNIEFVYDNQQEHFLFYKTNIITYGDDNALVKNQLEKFIKNPEGPIKYILTAISKKSSTNLVIEDDQTATQIESSIRIKYTLTSQGGQCLIDEKEIITTLDYKVKSSGYNFGSDSSKKEVNKKNIKKNIKFYLDYLLNKTDGIKCINDNNS